MLSAFQPRRGKRLMMLLVAFAATAMAVLGSYLVFWQLVGNVPRRHQSGERIAFALLQPNEHIVAKSVHGDRGVRLREYRFYWAAGAPHVDVLGNTDSFEFHKTEPLVTGRALRESEAEGLDAMVRYFRGHRDELSSGVGEYRITYFRENRQIGEEIFVGYRVTQQLGYFAYAKKRGVLVDASDYARLAAECDIVPAELKRLFPFEYLEGEQGANLTEGNEGNERGPDSSPAGGKNFNPSTHSP